MMNPATLMKLMSAKNQFTQAHPKFVKFMQMHMARGLEAGSVLEITVTSADGTSTTANMRVSQEDLALFQSLKELMKDQKD